MAPDRASTEGRPGSPDESAKLGQVAPTSGRHADDMRTAPRSAKPVATSSGGRGAGVSRFGRPEASTASRRRSTGRAACQEAQSEPPEKREAEFRLSSLLRNTQKRKLRERSNSSTSDYFSSSAQESPEKRNKQESKPIVIYENPLACGLADNLMHQQPRLKSWAPGRDQHGPPERSETKSDQQAQPIKTTASYLSANGAGPAGLAAGQSRTQATPGNYQEHSGGVYYYATPVGARAMPAGSQASSQRTNETTCDESPSNTELGYGYSPDRHLYSALAYEQHLAAPLWRPAEQARAVQEPIRQCIDQKLVHSEPLIRSSSWQNRTLVDLHRPHPAHLQAGRLELVQHVHQPSLHYLESSLVHKTLPVCFPQASLVAKMNEPVICSGSSSSDSALAVRPLHPCGARPSWPAGSSKRQLVAAWRPCTFAVLVLVLLSLLAGSLLLLVLPPSAPANSGTPFNYRPDSSLVVDQSTHDLQMSAPVRPAPLPPPPPPPVAQFEAPETSSERPAPSEPPEAIESSTQAYWRVAGGTAGGRCAGPGDRLACNQRGQCTALGACACLASFSGPTCAQANCPNECSQRGLCRLRPESTLNRLGAGQPDPQRRAHLDSLAFQTLSGSASENSICPSIEESERNHTWAKWSPPDDSARLFDHRLEWACECAPGFKGPDCSRLREMRCDDAKDDDQDGLVDCEDEDCCAHPSCRDNLMCFQSVEPASVLARTQLAGSGADWPPSFFARHAFLIANDSVQSYAHEQAFERSRAAVVRGRVVRRAEAERGIVSVRVSVIENTQLGFTLTRSDGYFDLLVNGNDWITLLFHRNGYTPIKRRLLVRALAINSMIEPLEMWPLGLAPPAEPQETRGAHSAPTAPSGLEPGADLRPSEPRPLPEDPFKLRARLELHRLAATISRRPNADDDRRLRQKLEACLLDQFARQPSPGLNFEPKLLNLDTLHDFPEAGEPLRAFAMASTSAFETRLKALKPSLAPTYSSATFPPAGSVVKPTVAVQLLPADAPIASLERVLVQLDIEGQTRHEHLQPESGLIYQFAWNRRDVYDQKVYGFARLNLRVGYQLKVVPPLSGNAKHQPPSASALASCLGPEVGMSQLQAAGERLEQLARQAPVIWFQRQVFMEAHQVNQLADVGRWALPSLSRLDPERNLIYMADGWTLPYNLVFPPVVRDLGSARVDPVPELVWADKEQQQQADQPTGRLLSLGPGDSLFLIQLGQSLRLIQLESASPHRRLLDLPLSILTSKLGLPSLASLSADDIQLLYNNYAQTLYLSSRSSGKIVQVSLASLQVLNKTFTSEQATAPPEDEIDIQPLLGFGRQQLSQLDWAKPNRAVRLLGPHSMTLDEERQLLYFLDGPASVLALDLSSNYVSLLLGGQPQTNSTANQAQANQGADPLSQTAAGATSCRLADRILAAGSWRPNQRIHSLVWNRADSSLYFVDQDVVYSLRQDMSLRMVAFGSGSAQCRLDIQLGSVKTLSADQANGDLIVVHQATRTEHPRRTQGRFYLAKIVSALRTSRPSSKAQLQQQASPLVDLHSSVAWDPLIARVAKWHSERAPIINWHELARPFERISLDPYVQEDQATRIPFIHLTGGLTRLDSLEVGPDGSIFVLDFGANSIKLIDFYSPNHFNLLEHRHLDTNRLFASSGLSNPPANQPPPANRKLRVLMVQNPISTQQQLLEFHSSSGLQLSVTSLDDTSRNGYHNDHHDSSSHEPIRYDFYYTILATNKLMDMDDDDKLDLSAKHLLSDYLTMMSGSVESFNQANDGELGTSIQASLALSSSYIRLHEISDSNGNSYKLVRAFTGSKYVIRSILLNNQLHAEFTTDYLGVLSSYKLLEGDETRLVVEIVYDSLTYLIRDIITRTNLNNQGNSKTIPQGLAKTMPRSQAKVKVQRKRVVYDRIFYHYCDLFIIDT